MPELPRIIKHGIKPEDKPLYFICRHCGCEYSISKKRCKEKSEYVDRNEVATYFTYPCPDCETNGKGYDYTHYLEKRNALSALNANGGDDT